MRNNGCEVIEIPANELYDEEAMSRHFRKLAGYLGVQELRDRLRSDRRLFQKAVDEAAAAKRFTLRLISPKTEERYVSCVPFVPLKAAAGAFGDPQSFQEGDWEWAVVETHRPLRPGMFAAKVVGKSMAPAIPDGSYCLFASPVTGTRQGRTVLVQLRDEMDPETGQRYTVKRYESEKAEAEGGTWRHVRITLRPNNPEFQPIVLSSDDEDSLSVIAEFLEVLG